MSDHRAVAFAAVDLGASSGRVVLGVVGDAGVEVVEIHRFANEPVSRDGALSWDVSRLFAETLHGLGECARSCAEREVAFGGIGIDSWGVDWGYLAPDGTVELPVPHYRSAPDPRAAIAGRTLSPELTYRISGIADQAINSGLRMAVDARQRTFDGEVPLFTPDLWVYWLTGAIGTDPTIASTSQLLDVRTRRFSPELVDDLGLSGLTLPDVAAVGTLAGHTSADITAALGWPAPVPVYRVAGHDTASAFAFAEPDGRDRDVLISSGTWSLVGVALTEPRTDDAARDAGLTNEVGASGVLLLRNLTGLWMLQECARVWSRALGADVDEILAQAERLPFDGRVFDAGDEMLFAAGDMETRIRALCASSGRPLDATPASVAGAILDSLAVAYATSTALLSELTGVSFRRVRIVGGGSRNASLCQRVSALTGLPVLTGPAEATAIGNLAVQAWAAGATPSIAAFYERLGPDEHPRSVNSPATEGTPS